MMLIVTGEQLEHGYQLKVYDQIIKLPYRVISPLENRTYLVEYIHEVLT